MKKTICRALLCLLLAACLLPLTARTAHADKIYDEIVNYQVDVTPNTEDGSLAIQVTLDWKPLEDLPATNSQQGGAKIGIPNGSIREMTALTDNIQSIDHDNSLAYIDFTQSYDANETFHFAFRWVQEYMYTLSDSGAVSYDYTPGWFKEAPVDVMASSGTTQPPCGRWLRRPDRRRPCAHRQQYETLGDRLNFTVEYASWPSTLYWENSRDNLPDNSRGDDSYDDSDDSDDWVFSVFVIFVLVIFFVIRAAVYDGYAGGFGTRYVFVHGLWYPGRPGMAAIPVPAPWAPSISTPRPAAAASAAESVAAVLEAVASAEAAAIAPAPPAVPVPVRAPAPAAAGLAAAPRICMAP